LDVAMMRISTETGLPLPTRSITRSWMARKGLACSLTSIFADFVEQRAARRFLELADAARHRPGERALLVPEQFLHLEQRVGIAAQLTR
jgi:hypothetical protein